MAWWVAAFVISDHIASCLSFVLFPADLDHSSSIATSAGLIEKKYAYMEHENNNIPLESSHSTILTPDSAMIPPISYQDGP